MNRYWADHPPVHLMIAAYLGIKPKSPSTDNMPDTAAEFFQAVTGQLPPGF